MRKTEIELYYERGMGELPSINVKIGYRQFAPGLTAEALNCDDDIFEKAIGYAFDMAQHRFWEEAQECAEHHLGRGVTVHALGRSGGHLAVEGLDPVERWNAITVSAWGRFVRSIETEISYLCENEQVRDDIEANRWNEEGAEAYNFIDRKDGTTVCISEMKKAAREAGFGPVVK